MPDLLAERAAQAVYLAETSNHPTIHCNRFPSWSELPEAERARRIASIESGTKTPPPASANERTAAMDALIADSADLYDAPASADAPSAVERVARALAKADGLDFDEVCGVDADPDEGYCDSATCVAAHWEEHDAEQARRWYMHLATAALSAMSPAGEVERIVAWLRADADLTEVEAAQINKNTTGNPRLLAAEWAIMIAMKRGIAVAIERGDYRHD